jgi:hypothetical protein
MLEKNVCSLSYSIRLHELGITRKSLFFREYVNDSCHGIKFYPYDVVPDRFNNYKVFHAYTASELLEILPKFVDTKTNKPFNFFRIEMTKFIFFEKIFKDGYIIRYVCDSIEVNDFPTKAILKSEYDDNLCNCLAKMLIFLLENKYIKID